MKAKLSTGVHAELELVICHELVLNVPELKCLRIFFCVICDNESSLICTNALVDGNSEYGLEPALELIFMMAVL